MDAERESVVSGMEKLIEDLKEIKKGCSEMAVETREANPGISYTAFSVSEVCERAIEAIQRNIPKEKEIEGGGTTWWCICPECHGVIDIPDHFCRHCGQAVKE